MRPEASSCTTSIWPRPIVLPLAMVAGGVADADADECERGDAARQKGAARQP